MIDILSGVTGSKVGEVSNLGVIETTHSELRKIFQRIDSDGFVVIPDTSETLDNGTVVEQIRLVYTEDSDFLDALKIYLLGEGFEIV